MCSCGNSSQFNYVMDRILSSTVEVTEGLWYLYFHLPVTVGIPNKKIKDLRCSHFNQNAYPPWTRQFSVTWKAWIAQSKQLDTCQHFQIQSSEYVLLSLSNISFTPCILSSFVLHTLCLVAIQSQSVTAVWLLSINYQFSIYLNYFKASSWGN